MGLVLISLFSGCLENEQHSIQIIKSKGEIICRSGASLDNWKSRVAWIDEQGRGVLLNEICKKYECRFYDNEGCTGDAYKIAEGYYVSTISTTTTIMDLETCMRLKEEEFETWLSWFEPCLYWGFDDTKICHNECPLGGECQRICVKLTHEQWCKREFPYRPRNCSVYNTTTTTTTTTLKPCKIPDTDYRCCAYLCRVIGEYFLDWNGSICDCEGRYFTPYDYEYYGGICGIYEEYISWNCSTLTTTTLDMEKLSNCVWDCIYDGRRIHMGKYPDCYDSCLNETYTTTTIDFENISCLDKCLLLQSRNPEYCRVYCSELESGKEIICIIDGGGMNIRPCAPIE